MILGDRGVLIRGASGSGKTTLGLTLLRNALQHGRHAALIGDDQLFVEARNDRLLVFAPPAIAGLAEVHGFGPHPVEFRRTGRIDLVVDLVGGEIAPRLQDTAQAEIAGAILPALKLAARETQRSCLAVLASLGWPPFGA